MEAVNANLSIRMLTNDDAIAFVDHLVRNAPTPGVGAPPISDPFPKSHKIDVTARIESAKKRWIMPIDNLGWGRAWGLFIGEKIVGEATLSSARLIETQLHRAILGMGIEPEYRGSGVGTALLTAALSWAKEQKSLAWIDLGVFAHNAAARRLYSNSGFLEVGRCVDCFRVDDLRVDDIQMTLDLRQYTKTFTGVFVQPGISTARLILEPITENHANEMWQLFSDPELHRFVPYEPLTLEKQRERCARWAKRRSPDGGELWLNWVGCHKETKEVMAHFQVGIKTSEDKIASIGYLVAKAFQGKGYALEGLETIFSYLRNELGIQEIKAWSDTRNIASHRLAQKLGMVQLEMIKDADFFKGSTSDEFVFSRRFYDV
ncbi:MAG: GNAT family N-acetyltransferase [Proteobacteria bacterium]|nr:GNAT family N-acetyltransferase [Pseudomonadota bacterium]